MGIGFRVSVPGFGRRWGCASVARTCVQKKLAVASRRRRAQTTSKSIG